MFFLIFRQWREAKASSKKFMMHCVLKVAFAENRETKTLSIHCIWANGGYTGKLIDRVKITDA